MSYKNFLRQKYHGAFQFNVAKEGYPCNLQNIKGKRIYDLKLYGNSVQDGTPSQDSQVEIQSVGDLVTDTSSPYYGKYDVPVTVCGKNLLDESKLTGLISHGNSLTKTVMQTSTFNKGIICKCKPNTKYILRQSKITSRFRVFYYSEKPVIGQTMSVGGIYSDALYRIAIVTTDTTQYLGISLGTNAEMEDTNVWLTEGTTATPYEPYKGATIHIYLDEPLRKVGDYADYVDYKNQKVVRCVDVLDDTGTKNISESYGILATPTEEAITFPELTLPDLNIAHIFTETSVPASNIKAITYR